MEACQKANVSVSVFVCEIGHRLVCELRKAGHAHSKVLKSLNLI